MRFLILFLALLSVIPLIAQAGAIEKEALSYVEKQQWSRLRGMLPRVRDPLVRDVALWHELVSNDQIATFDDYSAFLRRHPDWPGAEKMQIRAEISLLNEASGNPSLIEQWFASYPPKTERGIFFLEERRSRGKPSLTSIRRAWVQADMTEAEEKRFLVNYRSQLTQADHIYRTDRLLWEGQMNAAARMLPRLPKDEQAMFQARIALMKRQGNFDGLLNRVPSRLRNAPGLLYERLRFRFDKKMYDGVRELLLLAPKKLPYAAKWWPIQRYMIREDLDAGRYVKAAELTTRHGQEAKIELSEALWLKGWVDLGFLNRPGPALLEFQRFYEIVEFPISKSRGAYWAARAAKALGDAKTQKTWLMRAAEHPTTFYGQIAYEELNPGRPLALPPASATISEQEWQQLSQNSSLARAVLAVQREGYDQLVLPLLLHLAQSAKTAKMAAFAAHTGWKTGRADFAVRAAKETLNKGFYLPTYLFPQDIISQPLAVERPLAYAIARQESMFYPMARSAADARGMMQILPSTGRLVAAKHDLRFTPERLYEADYNFVLGSHYLKQLLDRFDKARILAIAGYNAGPGRPASWVQRYGRLSHNPDANIHWIERIPYAETRNYVQRVLENYQVYRALESKGRPPVTAREALLP